MFDIFRMEISEILHFHWLPDKIMVCSKYHMVAKKVMPLPSQPIKLQPPCTESVDDYMILTSFEISLSCNLIRVFKL